MNKRDFLVHSGGALLGATALKPTWASAIPSAAAAGEWTSPAKPAAPGTLDAWQAFEGQGFAARSALGRPLQLVLTRLSPRGPTKAASGGLEQFTLAFTGTRNLPLPEGLCMLQHPATGPLQLYLQPARHGKTIVYTAHFSLLASA
jgi:hypothetical protein